MKRFSCIINYKRIISVSFCVPIFDTKSGLDRISNNNRA